MTGIASSWIIGRLPMPPRVFATATSARRRPSLSPIPTSSAAADTKLTQPAANALLNAPNIGR
jgi:hypothetical protein